MEQVIHPGTVSVAPAIKVWIYRPTRSVTQSGRAGTRHWVIQPEPSSASFIEPLMGWTGSTDVSTQLNMTFPSRAQAVAFAERQGWACEVFESPQPRAPHRTYADNFTPPLGSNV